MTITTASDRQCKSSRMFRHSGNDKDNNDTDNNDSDNAIDDNLMTINNDYREPATTATFH